MKPLAYLFGFFIAGIIVLADLGMLGVLKFMNRIPFGDRIGHFVLYGILTLLIDLSLLRSPHGLNPSLLVLRVALILALVIGLEEFSQRFFPNRSFDLLDLAFSYLGVTFFSWAAIKIAGRDLS
ncbi:MAG: VanZ family protein [Anaerolineales bacterium]|nr:VanZ family protein [Anaerolineales bacterium]NUQ85833.1 VanZ family protein [Anaerolineales bacterium]